MSSWEATGKSDEWYTPKYVFDAMDTTFDLDVAHPLNIKTNVPANNFIYADSLDKEWEGFVWMNSPFEGRNGLVPWLDKFPIHGNGVCLTPDRTSTTWWQDMYKSCDVVLFVHGKIKFIRENGTEGKSPSNGTTLFGIGVDSVIALQKCRKSRIRCFS